LVFLEYVWPPCKSSAEAPKVGCQPAKRLDQTILQYYQTEKYGKNIRVDICFHDKSSFLSSSLMHGHKRNKKSWKQLPLSIHFSLYLSSREHLLMWVGKVPVSISRVQQVFPPWILQGLSVQECSLSGKDASKI